MGIVQDIAELKQFVIDYIEEPTGCKSVKKVRIVELFNGILDVMSEINSLPQWRDVSWQEMINDVDGYRNTYFNPEWIGLNPDIQIPGVVMYLVDIDYLNDGQGTIIFNEGKGLYNGQFFRAGNYQQYTPPTPSYPPAGTYRLINNSSIDTSYFITSSVPLLSGEVVNSAFTVGQSLIGSIAIGQKLNFIRYLSDGTVDLVLELTNPSSDQLNTSIMDPSKSYEFIYTDNEASTIPYPISWLSVYPVTWD